MTLEDLLGEAFDAGFAISCEGYNAEYPFGDREQDPRSDEDYEFGRDEAVKRLAEKFSA